MSWELTSIGRASASSQVLCLDIACIGSSDPLRICFLKTTEAPLLTPLIKAGSQEVLEQKVELNDGAARFRAVTGESGPHEIM